MPRTNYHKKTPPEEIPRISEAFWILVLIALVALIPSFIILAPQAVEYFRSLDFSIDFSGIHLPSFNQIASPTQQEALPQDMQRYYELKNLSCGTLSKDFLIATDDVAIGSIKGVRGIEGSIAGTIVTGYNLNQTTRTYVRGNDMKKVLITDGQEHATIWKDGRIYQCNPGCSMHLMGDAGWQSYLDTLSAMRTDCAYFGKTKLPEAVDMGRLIKIERAGNKTLNYYGCEDFLISGNATYAKTLLSSNMSLNEDQRALLWSLSHLAGPVEECLDEGTGIIVYRNITLDLTNSYRFNYSSGGYLHVNQQTTLTYYTDSVPESFLGLPG